MNAYRSGLRLATAAGAAGLAVLGFAPTAASAATDDSLTVAGGSSYTYTFNQSPSIKAVAQPNCFTPNTPITLSVSGPGVVNSTLVSATRDCFNPVNLDPSDSEVDTAAPAWSDGAPAMNGVYTLTLNNEGRTRSVSFTLLIPPARPRGFAVATSGANATFNWIANPEPDITSYTITDSSGRTVAAPTGACSGGSCTTGPVNLGRSVIGHTEKFSIRAVRSCGTASCSGGHVQSTSAATASGTFTAPPPTAKPTPSPTGSRTTSGSGGTGSASGSGSGGGGGALTFGGGPVRSSKHHSHNSSLPAVSGGVLPALGAPTLPGAESSTGPLQLGKPGGKIAYPAPVVADKHKSSTVRSISHDITSSFSSRSLWQGIGAGAVLLLLAFHLRTWANRETL